MVLKGDEAQFAVARESTFKTRPSTVDQQPGGGVREEIDFTDEETLAQLRMMGGDRSYHELVKSDESREVSIPTYLQNAKLFEFVLGSISEDTTGASSAPYTHEITQGSTLPTLTGEYAGFNTDSAESDRVVTLLGGMMTSAEIVSSSDNDAVEADYDLNIASIPDINTNTEDSTSLISVRPFKHEDLATYTFDGTDIPHIEELTLTIENEVTELPDNGSYEAGDFVPLNLNLSADVTFTPQGIEFYQKYENGVEAPLVFKWERGTDDAIEFNFADARIESPGFSMPLEEVTQADMTLTARDVTITVTSSESTYALQ